MARRSFVITAILLVIVLTAVGYYLADQANRAGKGVKEGGVRDSEESPVGQQVVVTLYFGNKDASGVAPEERVVRKTDASIEEMIIKELIKGPQTELNKSIPEGTRLLSIKVKNAIAYVDFSQEFQTNHWGGSAGEMITLYSVVNSLTELDNIAAVQFLVEGKRIESLAGHWSTDEPMVRDESLIVHDQQG